MPKIAANLTFLFNEVPFLERYAAAAACGFRGVECLFPYEAPAGEVARRLRDHGLTQALINLPPGDWNAGERGFAAVPGREQTFRDALATALDYAATIGCPRVHVMAGMTPDGADPARMEETFVANLAHAAPIAAARGIGLLIEPLNDRDAPGYFLSRTNQAARIIAAVAAPNLALQYDLYHAQIMEGDLVRTFEAHRDIIGHIQFSGVPDRHEPDASEIDIHYLFKRIDALGYDGWAGAEYMPAAGTEAGLGWARRYGISACAD